MRWAGWPQPKCLCWQLSREARTKTQQQREETHASQYKKKWLKEGKGSHLGSGPRGCSYGQTAIRVCTQLPTAVSKSTPDSSGVISQLMFSQSRSISPPPLLPTLLQPHQPPYCSSNPQAHPHLRTFALSVPSSLHTLSQALPLMSSSSFSSLSSHVTSQSSQW